MKGIVDIDWFYHIKYSSPSVDREVTYQNSFSQWRIKYGHCRDNNVYVMLHFKHHIIVIIQEWNIGIGFQKWIVDNGGYH